MSSDEKNTPTKDTEDREHKRTSHKTNDKTRKSMKKKKKKPKKTLTKHKTNKSKGKGTRGQKSELKIPVGDDGKFHCPKCIKSYTTKGGLCRHIRACHQDYAKTLFPVLCKIHKCSMRFGSPMAADKHLDAKHPLYAGNNKYRYNPIAIT
eukprot:42327_1